MPGMYATLPGAYRVVQLASNVNPQTMSYTTADGSLFVSGQYTNLLTGARSAQTALFEIQGRSTWSQYSDIIITSGTTYFRNLAVKAAAAVPPLPTDGGVLAIGASGALSLHGTNYFAGGVSDLAPGSTGAGGQAQISGENIYITDGDASSAAPAGAIVLDVAQIDGLGATSVLIGGTAAPNARGILITPTAKTLEVHTSKDAPLTAPDLILVTTAGGNGLTVDQGSVIRAVGTGDAGEDVTIGAVGGASGDSAVLRVSNGAPISITQLNLPSSPLAAFSIASGVTIDGGNSLTLASSGSGSIDASATLTARNYDFLGNVINIGDNVASGLVLTSATLAKFAGASVQLHSASTINFYDASGLAIGVGATPIGSLTLDAAAFTDQGGVATINADNVVLGNLTGSSTLSGMPASGSGTLAVKASDAITIGGAAKGSTLTLAGFGAVKLTAAKTIDFAGGGTFNAGAAAVTLAAPALVVNGGAAQTLTTTGALTIVGAGKAPTDAASNIGGALTLRGGSIADSGVIQALSGNVTLIATSGDIVLNSGAQIIATGSTIPILDQAAYTPGGNVELLASAGAITLTAGSSIDVSAAGPGYAGSVTLAAARAVTLAGALTAKAAYKDAGGEFMLIADSLAGALPVASGFTRSFAASLQQGDIDIPGGATLTSQRVVLTANGGRVSVEGTIDASGASGGAISLYGANGVAIGGAAQLVAASRLVTDVNDPGFANGAAQLVQTGGVITLGVTGTPTGSYNADGSERVTGSGRIDIAADAVLDVSGGSGKTDLRDAAGKFTTAVNTDGQIILRAPLLADRSVNIAFAGTVKAANGGGGGIILDAYEVWSAADATTGPVPFRRRHRSGGLLRQCRQAADLRHRRPLSRLDARGARGRRLPAARPVLPGDAGRLRREFRPFQSIAAWRDFKSSCSTGDRPRQSEPQRQRRQHHGRQQLEFAQARKARPASDSPPTGPRAGSRACSALRAVNNVNIVASISDGFFQQYPDTPLPTLLTPTITGVPTATDYYNQELAALADYRDPNSGQSFSDFVDSSGNFIFYDANGNANTQAQIFGEGSYIPLSLIGPDRLQAPAVFSNAADDPVVASLIDQYDQYYYQYTQLFDVYAKLTTWDQHSFLPSGQSYYLPPSALDLRRRLFQLRSTIRWRRLRLSLSELCHQHRDECEL